MGRFAGLVCLVVAVGFLSAACGGADKRAAAYRDKARERYQAEEFGKAAADYAKAIDLDKKKKLDGLAGEHQRALHEYVLSRLHEAWRKFDRGDYEDAHSIILGLFESDAYGDAKLKKQIVKSLGDLAAARMSDADSMADKNEYLSAVLLAQYLVKPLPPDHSLRVRVEALRKVALAKHTLLMRAARGKPGSVAFHYLMTQFFGGSRLNDGIAAVRAAKRAGGDASSYVSAARTAATAGKTFDAEQGFVLGRAAGSSWDSGAVKYFKVQWGVPDEKALESLWTGDPVPSPYAAVGKDELPDPDYVSIGGDDDDDDDFKVSSVSSWRGLDIYYGLGTQTLDDTNYSARIGGDLYIPRKKYAHRPAFHFESDSLGGGVVGYGVEWQLQKRFGKALVGIGVGYWQSEQAEEQELDVPVLKARSAYVPISVRYPLVADIVLGADFQANYFHLAKSEDDGYEHYSVGTGRLFLPLPLLPEIHKLFRGLSLEGYVSYADGAPNDLYYGGKLVYHRSMSSGGDDDDDDVWDKVKKSVFATQSVLGPTVDLWYQLGGSHLRDDLDANGMGVLFRIPTDKPRKAKTIIEPSVWVFASGFGGDVGGWGLQIMGLKPVKSLGGVFGYGLGYSSASESDVPDGSTEYKERAFYIPLVFRMPLASKLIANLEWRGNLLGLGGTKEPGEDQAFSPLSAGLWTPLPLLSSLGSVFKKLHLEAHVSYAYGAQREVAWGGSLFYRPIVDID